MLSINSFGIRAQTEQNPDPEICVGQPEGKLLPYPGDCEKYFSCSKEQGWINRLDEQIFIQLFDNIKNSIKFWIVAPHHSVSMPK